LEFCARALAELATRDPLVTAIERDEAVGDLDVSLGDFYKAAAPETEPGAAGLDGDLRAIFADLAETEQQGAGDMTRPAAELIRRLERQLMADVFRWTGHFPEKTRSLVRDLAKRADALKQVYPLDSEDMAVVSVTILVTSLAMNFVHRGAYFPEPTPAAAPASAQATNPGSSQG
jgi:hypothetical protein